MDQLKPIDTDSVNSGDDEPGCESEIRLWGVSVFLRGLGQAALLYILSGFVGGVLMAFVPILFVVHAWLLGPYVQTLLFFVIGSGFLAYHFPDLAFWRGAVAFLWLLTFDAVMVSTQGEYYGIFPWSDFGIDAVMGLAGLGMIFSAFGSAVGAALAHDFSSWARTEWEEFLESVGMLPEEEYLEDDEEDGSESDSVTQADPETACGREC